MDQRGETEERNSEDSTGHRRKDDDATGDGGNHGHEESMDQRESRDGYDEAEETTAGVFNCKEVEVVVVDGGSEEDDSAPLFAHPCSLLRLLLRACAGCLSMHGYCSDDDDPKPDADEDDVPSAAAPADSPQEGDDHQGAGDDKAASCLYMQGEVVTRVWAVRRPTAPGGRPVEGSGGHGGHHH